MKKILSVFGTRPEAIKMAPVIKEFEKRDAIKSVVCVTAQHRNMLDQVLEVFDITPDYDLDIMKQKQSLSYVTAEVLKGIEEIIEKEAPDLVLVHGDTTTAMAASLAAFYQQVKIGHVEAGLRTFDKYSPFPEEINRQIIDRLSDYLFAPTQTSSDNIVQLNKDQKIIVTGNTAIDALKITVTKDYTHEVLKWAEDSRMILVTAHRRENLGNPLRQIFSAIKRIVNDFPDVKVVYPVHLNPRVQEIARSVLGDCNRIKLIEPLNVLEFHNFMDRAYFIMSDSGGVQEEAPSLGKPVLVLRDTTERPEGIKAGTLKLVGTNEEEVYNSMKLLLSDRLEYEKMAKATNPYGDGFASMRIVDAILSS